ncbi:prepilin peptidase [Paenibacillus allorhizosphaerae]|uniref:Prepilin type IV endopeptidase peptidase domain-containing protein n=1 Tax=Paenibacillus allorhizosphaerae TaxID=2849866 RepID=A0ABM8VNC2_9BACL|nr:A24 family peptidase [Paenibacillus allorhizosphaerae]CAG7651275.1 hypothetical protein PAECIP111802_04923 [Paenibacillus allorhizosphaerae]
MDWQQTLVYGQMVPIMASAAFTDWKYRKVFNIVSIPAIIAMIITRIFIHPQGWLFYTAALIPALVYYIFALFTNEVGGGDILIVAYLGIASGIVATLLSVINAGFVGLILYYVEAFIGKKKPHLQQPWVSLLFIGFCIGAVQITCLKFVFPFINPWG